MNDEDLKDLQRVNDEDMENVSGGFSVMELLSSRKGKIVERECESCGKKFKCYQESLNGWYCRRWYSRFCFECAKKHEVPTDGGIEVVTLADILKKVDPVEKEKQEKEKQERMKKFLKDLNIWAD